MAAVQRTELEQLRAIAELLRQALPYLTDYAAMLRRKGNQPTLEGEVRQLFEAAQAALMGLGWPQTDHAAALQRDALLACHTELRFMQCLYECDLRALEDGRVQALRDALAAGEAALNASLNGARAGASEAN